VQIIQAKQMLTPNGWEANMHVCISKDGRIEQVEKLDAVTQTTVDLLLPAPTNLHSHAFQRAMSGLTEARGPDPSDSFWTWRRLMYRYLDQLMPDHMQAIAEMVFMEMLEAGYASVAEFHYLHHGVGGASYANQAEMSERIVAAAQNTGVGLTLLPVLYQFGGCDKRALEGGQRRFGCTPDQFVQLHAQAGIAIKKGAADFSIGVAPHSLRAVDGEGLDTVLGIVGDNPIHMHLAEQVAEVEEVQAHTGARPTEWLLDNHQVDAAWCLIHCTQMTLEETQRLAQTGAVAGLCPITESSLGDGIFNGTQYLADGGSIGVGSDSNIHIALFDELRTLEYSQRLRDRTRAALATRSKSTGRVLFEGTVKDSAQAAGRASGQIAEGAWADLIGISADNAWLCNRQGDTALDSLIFGGHGHACIEHVWSAGRHVVNDGLHSDRERIMRAFQSTVEQLGQDF